MEDVTALDRAQVRFEAGDTVRFIGRSGSKWTGTIEKLNPKRAVVRCEDGEAWSVPYDLLDLRDGAHRPGNERRLVEVAEEARKRMDEHGLVDWTFRFSATRNRLGECRERERMVLVSRRHAVSSAPAEVRDTILHEIAHALAGTKAGHGPAWKEVARRIGATPKARAAESAGSRAARQAVKAKFRSGAKVRFADRRGRRHAGTIVRMNPKRASVKCENGAVYLVPYAGLESAVPMAEEASPGGRDPSG